MERFEVRAVRGGRPPRLVLKLQHPFVDGLDTCVVAPLADPSALPPMDKLRPVLTFEDRTYVVAVDRLAAIDRGQLGPVLGRAPELQDAVTRAVDFLFQGF